jgi:hypothetical protein
MKRTPLKRMGKDKARESRRYWRLRLAYLENIPICEFEMAGLKCSERSTEIHHMKGQHHKIMNDTRYWFPVCAEHHAWIEDHKRDARKMGLILYK